jgi:phosphatidate phosphatase APP1
MVHIDLSSPRKYGKKGQQLPDVSIDTHSSGIVSDMDDGMMIPDDSQRLLGLA